MNSKSSKSNDRRKTIFIVAGDFTEFVSWLKTNGRDNVDYFYVFRNHAEKIFSLAGMKNPTVIFVGGYGQRSDLGDVIKSLAYRIDSFDVLES